MSDNKIPISDLIDNADIFESIPEATVKKKTDFTVLVLIIIAVISILGTVLYFKFSLVPVDDSLVLAYKETSSLISRNSVLSSSNQNKSEKVNINTANKETLCTLYLIGDSRALSIISYREANGNFKSIEEIRNVKGIGDTIFNKIKDNICV